MRGWILAVIAGAGAVGSIYAAGEIDPLLQPALVTGTTTAALAYLYVHQTDLLLRMGKRKAAIKQLDERLARYPQDTTAYVKRARLHCMDRKYPEAVDDYRQALMQIKDRRSPELYTELSQVYFAMQKYDAALEAAEAAYAVKARFHPTLAWLAIIHYARRSFSESRIWWQSAREKYPDYRKLDGTNWVRSQPGWLERPLIEAQKITALLNSRG